MSVDTARAADPVAAVLRGADPDLMREVRTILRQYEQNSDLRPFVRLAVDWLVIAGAMSLWLVMPYLPGLGAQAVVYLFAVAVVSGRLRALESCTHDATHNALFRTRSWNTRFQFLFAWPILDQVQGYRHEHIVHHSRLGEPDDPAQLMLVEMKAHAFPRSFVSTMIVRPLLGYHTIWYIESRIDYCRDNRYYLPQMLCFWVPILALVTWLGVWPWFALFYLVPLFLVLPALLILSEITDHASMDRRCPIGGSRNNIGLLQGLIIHTHNDGYHLVHHIDPRIPAHMLRRAHERLMQIPAFRARCIESHSYVQTLRQLKAGTPPAQEAAAPHQRGAAV